MYVIKHAGLTAKLEKEEEKKIFRIGYRQQISLKVMFEMRFEIKTIFEFRLKVMSRSDFNKV
jgi:hypothetical protein